MNNRLKKPVALFLAMVMITTSVPLFAMAENVGSAPSFADVIESADEQTVPPNSSSDDTELTPFSLLPIEEKSAEIDLSGYTVKQLESMTVGELFGNLKDSDGEAIDVSDATKTVWKNFYDEDGYGAYDIWKVLKMTDKIDILYYCFFWYGVKAEIIIGSGDQLNDTDVRYFVDFKLPKKSAYIDLKSFNYPDLVNVPVSELLNNFTVNGEALTINDPETVEILWDITKLKRRGVNFHKESETNWLSLTINDNMKIASEQLECDDYYWTETQNVLISADGVIGLYEVEYRNYPEIYDTFDFALYEQNGKTQTPIDIKKTYDYVGYYTGSGNENKYCFRGIDGQVNSSYNTDNYYYFGFDLRDDLADKYELTILDGWDYDISTLRTQILSGKNIGKADITKKFAVDDMTATNAGVKAKWLGYCAEGRITVCIKNEDNCFIERLWLRFYSNSNDVYVSNNMWTEGEYGRNEVDCSRNLDEIKEKINGKWYYTDLYTYELPRGYSAKDEYSISMYFRDGDAGEYIYDATKIDKAVVGRFYSLEEAKSAKDIKDQLFVKDMNVAGAGYKDNFSGYGVDFTIFAGDDIWHIRVVTEEAKEIEKPDVGSSDRYFRVENLYSDNDILDTYVIPYEQDTYYSNGYQTLLINDDAVDMTKVSPYAYLGYHAKVFYNGVEEKTEGSNSKLSARDFTVVPEDTTRNPQNSVEYTVSAENHINQKNYWITAVKKESGAKLFVNGPDEREIFLDDYYDNIHDIFVANIGSEELTGIKVELDATNVKLDDYWTLGGEGNNTLAPFTTTKNDTGNYYGELFNVAKIRLIPDGEGEIDGTLTISADGQKSKVIHLTGVAGNPKIDTTSISEAVKYVPYSAIITTNNMHDWNDVTFELASGKLPEGVELYPSGEIYGVPKETGKFSIKVKANYSHYDFSSSYATFTLVVKDNTDENVDASVDKGYEITTRVPKNIKEYKDTKFEIEGVLAEFIDFWLDGEKLVRDIDYTAEEGSTNITIKSQTFKNAGTGKHTISAEFRVDGDANKELKKASQNYTKGGSSSGGAGGATGGKVDENKGNVKDQGVTGRVDVDNNTYKVRFESNGGNAVDPLNVNKDTVLTSVPTPERAGFKFGGWYTDKELTKPFDISTKITAAIQLYAKWIEDKPVTDASEFVDVSKNEWFYNDVKWAHENKLMIGISNVEFAPNEAITGGMVVTVLARIANVDVSKYENEKYDDVYEGQWYTPYAKWAKAAGLVDGIPFNPPAEISREAMGVILSRFIDAMGAKYEITEEFIKFADADLISDTAMEAMQTLFKLEIFKGRGNNVIDPASNTTRAEFAALTHRVTGILNK